jgi:hypothetical protein
MKNLIIALLLLAATPALAAYKPTAAQWKGICTWEAEAQNCRYGSSESVKKSCAAADKLEKRLKAQGFCTYGHGVVGRASKRRDHCYTIH